MQPASYLSHLFILRLWKEERTGDDAGVRIKVRHVLSGETAYFRDWPAAIAFAMEKLDENGRSGSPDHST